MSLEQLTAEERAKVEKLAFWKTYQEVSPATEQGYACGSCSSCSICDVYRNPIKAEYLIDGQR